MGRVFASSLKQRPGNLYLGLIANPFKKQNKLGRESSKNGRQTPNKVNHRKGQVMTAPLVKIRKRCYKIKTDFRALIGSELSSLLLLVETIPSKNSQADGSPISYWIT